MWKKTHKVHVAVCKKIRKPKALDNLQATSVVRGESSETIRRTPEMAKT